MELTANTGLVLEGGGMRGVFTCGVLDYLIDNAINFNYAIGVSAGACNGLSYMSHQRGRAKKSNIDMLDRYHYIGVKYLFSQRSIMDLDLLYRKFPQSILPYDYDAYFSNKAEFEMVTTDCRTGKPLYLSERNDAERLLNLAKASSSLPFVMPIVWIDGTPMLDGGIGDSIPLLRSIEKGHRTNVVVLTRNAGYRKTGFLVPIPKFIYRKYPLLRDALMKRVDVYNAQLDMVERMEREGSIVVVRPQKPVEVGRIETDSSKLLALYNEGYDEAARVFSALNVEGLSEG
ncbi:MAG: patatin family protein [Bacteroidaceae bacterium]|nr:patatin family protein [Bacteroidaceae bacterium]